MKMKLLVIFAFVILAGASCTPHRTCATYLKNTQDVKSNEAKF